MKKLAFLIPVLLVSACSDPQQTSFQTMEDVEDFITDVGRCKFYSPREYWDRRNVRVCATQDPGNNAELTEEVISSFVAGYRVDKDYVEPVYNDDFIVRTDSLTDSQKKRLFTAFGLKEDEIASFASRGGGSLKSDYFSFDFDTFGKRGQLVIIKPVAELNKDQYTLTEQAQKRIAEEKARAEAREKAAAERKIEITRAQAEITKIADEIGSGNLIAKGRFAQDGRNAGSNPFGMMLLHQSPAVRNMTPSQFYLVSRIKAVGYDFAEAMEQSLESRSSSSFLFVWDNVSPELTERYRAYLSADTFEKATQKPKLLNDVKTYLVTLAESVDSSKLVSYFRGSITLQYDFQNRAFTLVDASLPESNWYKDQDVVESQNNLQSRNYYVYYRAVLTALDNFALKMSPEEAKDFVDTYGNSGYRDNQFRFDYVMGLSFKEAPFKRPSYLPPVEKPYRNFTDGSAIDEVWDSTCLMLFKSYESDMRKSSFKIFDEGSKPNRRLCEILQSAYTMLDEASYEERTEYLEE